MYFKKDMFKNYMNVFPVDETYLEKFENKYNIKLAQAHKDLLLTIGIYGASSFFVEEYNFNEYDKIIEAIEENFNWKVDFKDGYFPFTVMTNPDTIFSCYRLDEGDNPPIYRCSEVDKIYKKVYNSFSECYYELHKHKFIYPPVLS